MFVDVENTLSFQLVRYSHHKPNSCWLYNEQDRLIYVYTCLYLSIIDWKCHIPNHLSSMVHGQRHPLVLNLCVNHQASDVFSPLCKAEIKVEKIGLGRWPVYQLSSLPVAKKGRKFQALYESTNQWDLGHLWLNGPYHADKSSWLLYSINSMSPSGNQICMLENPLQIEVSS